MTALKGRQIADFLKRRPENIAAVLIYGPDASVVRDRSDALAKSVVSDFKDPFNFLELDEADLKTAPSRLADEAAALSFVGGMRVVRVRGAGEWAAGPAKTLVDWLEGAGVAPNALTLIEAGELTKRSKLRTLFEGARAAAALPCYEDAPQDARALTVSLLTAEDLEIDEDALAAFLVALGSDRGLIKSEVEKLVLYAGPKSPRPGHARIRRADIDASLADPSGAALGDIVASCADGRLKALADGLNRFFAGGGSPIAILRAAQRQFDRLYAAQRLIDAGDAPKAAMKKLRPPVFFAEERAFEARLSRLPIVRLEQALKLLLEAELQAKATGAPQTEITERALLRLARMAARS